MIAIPSYTEIIELLKKGATLEAQTKIMELREALLSEKEENNILHLQIHELEKQLEIKDQLNWDGKMYWLIKNGVNDGPYCQQCYDSNKKLIRLQKSVNNDCMLCKTCKNIFS